MLQDAINAVVVVVGLVAAVLGFAISIIPH
jgi:hypothetical protein